MVSFITIPEPCNENWNTMTPNERGRHCDKCSKTVIDFSTWELQEIVYYLKQHKSDQVCGRFKKEQLDTPVITLDQFVAHVNYMPLSYLKKIAMLFLFVFALASASCNSSVTTPPETVPPPTHTTGAPINNTSASTVNGDSITEPVAEPLIHSLPMVPEVVPMALGGVQFIDDHQGGAPILEEPPVIDSSAETHAIFSYPREEEADTADIY